MALPKRNKILQTWQRLQVNNVLGTGRSLVLPLNSFKFRIWHDRRIEVLLMKEGPSSGGMAETSICSLWEESWWSRCSDLAPEFLAVMTRSKYRLLQQKLGCPMKALLVALPLRAKRRPCALGATRRRRQAAMNTRRKGWRRRSWGGVVKRRRSAVPRRRRVPESAECQENDSSLATTCLYNTRSVGDNDAPSNSQEIIELDGLESQREEKVPRKEEVEEPLDVETVDNYTTFGESSSTNDFHSHSLEHTTQNLDSEINRPSERYESVPENVMHVEIDNAEERTLETEADITIDDFNNPIEVCVDNSDSIGHTEISLSYAQPSAETESVEIRGLEDVDIETVDEEGDTNMWSQVNTRGSMQTEMLEDESMDIDLLDDTDPMVVPDEWCDTCRRQFAPANEIIALTKRFRFTKWIGALLGYVGLGTIEDQDSWTPSQMLEGQRMNSSSSTSSDQTRSRFSL